MSCICRALEQQQYLKEIEKAGFKNVHALSSKEFYIEDERRQTLTMFVNITVKAHKSETRL